MLALTGRKSDGWLPTLSYLGPDRLGEAIDRIDDAAHQAGRDPAAIRKVYNLGGLITPAPKGPFHGPVQQWVQEITTLVRDQGMNGFVYWPDQDHQRQLALFAHEVVPAVRQNLATWPPRQPHPAGITRAGRKKKSPALGIDA